MAFDQFADPRIALRARRAELLTAEQEAILARAWRDHGDKSALDRLIGAYMRLAISMAGKFKRYGSGMGDLTQEAALGLMKAAEKFDPDRGVRFSTYAMFWIKAQLQDYVMRNWSLVRTGSTTAQKSLFFNLRRIEARLTRAARDRGERLEGAALSQAVADELGVSLADVKMMEGRLSGSDASLNMTQAGEDEGREWIDLLEAEEPVTFAERHDHARLREALLSGLATLPPRERLILRARQLEDEPRTLESLGQELGLSKERIRQLEAAALLKMRRVLEAQGLGALL